MSFRKLFTAAAAAAMVSVLFVMPVSAHHGHHRQAVDDTCYPVCTVEDCTEEGRHLHDDEYYCGYDHADGYCDGSCVAVEERTSYGHGCGRGRRCHR